MKFRVLFNVNDAAGRTITRKEEFEADELDTKDGRYLVLLKNVVPGEVSVVAVFSPESLIGVFRAEE